MTRNFVAELRPYIGDPPTEPGQASAIGYHRRILHALRTWPKGFDRPLYKALLKRERRWGPRAAGMDPRWNRVGSQGGRLPNWLHAELFPSDPRFDGPITDEDLTD